MKYKYINFNKNRLLNKAEVTFKGKCNSKVSLMKDKKNMFNKLKRDN